MGIALLLIICFLIYLFPVLRDLNTREGQMAFRNKIDDSGLLGFLWLFGIQVLQIFLFIIPGEPIEVLAGMCYGGFWGTIFIMLSSTLISATIFFLVRAYGKRFIGLFCEEDRIEKIENSKLFRNPKKIEFILFLLFFIPGTPKDLLSYLAGLLPIRPLRYLFITTIARIPSILSSTMAGDSLLLGNWQQSLLIYGITFFIIAVILVVLNLWDKNHLAGDTLKTLKNEKL